MKFLNDLSTIFSALIGGLFAIIVVILTYYLNKKDKRNPLISEELEETISADGSRHKREKKIYKQ